jgi:hypothetical protein
VSPRWCAVVGGDASVDPRGPGASWLVGWLVSWLGENGWGPRKQEPWGLNHCPQRSGAEGETRAALMVLFTAHCSPRRGVCPCGGLSSKPEPGGGCLCGVLLLLQLQSHVTGAGDRVENIGLDVFKTE